MLSEHCSENSIRTIREATDGKFFAPFGTKQVPGAVHDYAGSSQRDTRPLCDTRHAIRLAAELLPAVCTAGTRCQRVPEPWVQTSGKGTPPEMVKAPASRLARQQLLTLRGLASANWSGQRISKTSLQHRRRPRPTLLRIVATLLPTLHLANMTILRRELASMKASMPRTMAIIEVKKQLHSGGITT